MSTDVLVTQELKSLRAELSAAQQARLASPVVTAAPPTNGAPVPVAARAAQPIEDDDEALRPLRELANEATAFFEAAEKNISAHPTESVVGALVLGILIGRLLPRI